MAISARGGGIYDVDSDSGNSYVVDLLEGRCSCPDHQIRGERCKHVRRVALEITVGNVPAPGRRAVTCTACGTEAFVRESDPAVCDRCRLPPGTTVRDRETGDLLVVVETTGERADEVYVPARGDTLDAYGEGETTVADYPNNHRYPRSDPVVRAVYPFSGDAEVPFEERRRYSFPLSRLDAAVDAEDETENGDRTATEAASA